MDRFSTAKRIRGFPTHSSAPLPEPTTATICARPFRPRWSRTAKRRLNDEPRYRGYTELLPQDNLSKLKFNYAEAGGTRENLRYGWVRRG